MAAETSTALKEALYAQQQLLQKLYNELEVERDASATAASEALAMILRLQGEKAGVKMESEHYKRLAEEKMYHAEESMEIFEELIHQKEMEIANLDYQLQAYRYKLSSLGLEDIDLLQLNEKETSPESLSRRNSAPPKLLKLAYLKRNRSASPDSDMVPKTVEEIERLDESHQTSDSEKQTEGINSYWDQIRKLDKIVEEMGKSCQLNESENEMILDTCNVRVHDVFEVPETNEDLASHEKQVKDIGKSILEGGYNVEKPATFVEDHMKSFEKTLFLNKKDKEVFLPKDNIVVDCRMAVDVVEGEGSSQRVNTTTEITEGDVRSQERVTGREEEMLRLLHEINKKLDCIQAQTKSGKTEKTKPSPNYDLPMLQLQEAMLHFWL
ncbi:putative GTD-binding domain-containing protein [Helianthus debilis subsp. tardiflorus]